MANNLFCISVQTIKGIGPKTKATLEKLGITTVLDLLEHYPIRYEDRSCIKTIIQTTKDSVETIRGRVITIKETKPRQRLTVTKLYVTDETATIALVFFNQPFLKNQYKQGTKVIASGKVSLALGSLEMNNVEIEVDEGDPLHLARIVPIYPSTEGLSQRVLRNLIRNALEAYSNLLTEPLPSNILTKHQLPSKAQALQSIHFPNSFLETESARKRLVFEEFFILQYGLALMQKNSHETVTGICHKPNGQLLQTIFSNLPFDLTSDQQRSFNEIASDMEKPYPMNRLLQGDVGSGKTIIAALALAKTVENGYQGALMAPTETLAEQHYASLKLFFKKFSVSITLLTGSLNPKEKAERIASISSGNIDIVIGTHALIQDAVKFSNLGLVVTDEQHRFGVNQRLLLQQKGNYPDILVMTATPIPRTLTLTVYGDLTFSSIKQMPPGRQPIKTYCVHSGMRDRLNNFIQTQVTEGRQVYIVCPLVGESEKIQALSAIEYADKLRTIVFPNFKIGLLHGQLKQHEKEAVMKAFYQGDIQILVATSVIEVGINVPNATLIIIEGAERFGLAQLHQLRGRVGRGQHQSYCVLVTDSHNLEVRTRMQIITKNQDGFILAEKDMELRGPGDILGTRQHGLPQLKIADIVSDQHILEQARQAAFTAVQHKQSNTELRHMVLAKFSKQLHYFFIG